MRLVVVAGKCGSGKTTLIKNAAKGNRFTFIGSNHKSAEELKDAATIVDSYPLKSPCARVRQYTYRVELHSKDDVPIIVSEPPSGCLEQSSPMLNPMYVNQKDTYTIGPLITAVDGRGIVDNILIPRFTEGLRMHNMIEESDVIAVTFSDYLSEGDREAAEKKIRDINDTCEIVFCTKDGEGSERISELIFGDAQYTRPLYY